MSDDDEITEVPALPNAQLAQEYAVLWGVREIFEPKNEEESDGDE